MASANPAVFPGIGSEPDIPIIPNSDVADAGWALARLNDGGDIDGVSFSYPKTTTPVRLYLIDSGVAHVSTWFSQNPNFKSFQTQLIRASTDPLTSSAVIHGTQMLSLVSGPGTGAAVGTPVHVVNYNIFPGTEGSTSTISKLAGAVLEATRNHTENPSFKSVLLIANGSSYAGTSALLDLTITRAVEAGITVVVSAGNEGKQAANYIPSAYGTKNGVICVGALNNNNKVLASSNKGAAVDLYAPGQNVRVVNVANPSGAYKTITGTSPAAALTAAAALIELSLNPALTPAAVENILKANAYRTTAPAEEAVSLVQVTPEPDSDLDGVSDTLEIFFGSNPNNPAIRPDPVTFARVGNQLRISFKIAGSLYNPLSPYTLNNGSTWRVQSSPNLVDWSNVSNGSLSHFPAVQGRIPVTFSVPKPTGKSHFLRIDVTPPPTAP